jgi:hypothetical protein
MDEFEHFMAEEYAAAAATADADAAAAASHRCGCCTIFYRLRLT